MKEATKNLNMIILAIYSFCRNHYFINKSNNQLRSYWSQFYWSCCDNKSHMKTYAPRSSIISTRVCSNNRCLTSTYHLRLEVWLRLAPPFEVSNPSKPQAELKCSSRGAPSMRRSLSGHLRRSTNNSIRWWTVSRQNPGSTIWCSTSRSGKTWWINHRWKKFIKCDIKFKY